MAMERPPAGICGFETHDRVTLSRKQNRVLLNQRVSKDSKTSALVRLYSERIQKARVKKLAAFLIA